MNDAERAHWLAARAGKLTASRMAEAMAFKKDGKPAAARINLLHELLAERITGLTVRHFVSNAMQHGIECEPMAIEAYEIATGRLVQRGHYFDHPEIDNLGATPDGLLDDGGLLEIKCPTPQKFVRWVLAREVPAEHRPQMIVQCMCTGRRWVDFAAYDPRIRDPNRQLFIVRYEPTDEEYATVRAAAEQFLADLDAMFEQFTAREVA